MGRLTEILVDEDKVPGVYTVNFDAKDLPGGFYFCGLKTGNYWQAKKMVLIN